MLIELPDFVNDPRECFKWLVPELEGTWEINIVPTWGNILLGGPPTGLEWTIEEGGRPGSPNYYQGKTLAHAFGKRLRSKEAGNVR